MSSSRLVFRRRLPLALLVLGAIGCEPDRLNTPPPNPLAPEGLGPNLSVEPESIRAPRRLGSFAVPPDPFAFQETAITLPAGTHYVRIRISGGLSVRGEFFAVDIGPSGWIDVNTCTQDGCPWRVRPQLIGEGFEIIYDAIAPITRTESEVIDLMEGPGRFMVSRASGPREGDENCCTFSGSQTMTIDIVGVEVVASNAKPMAGDSVRFDARGLGVVLGTPTYWTYNGSPIDSCADKHTCTYLPPGDGVMRVFSDVDVESGFVAGETAIDVISDELVITLETSRETLRPRIRPNQVNGLPQPAVAPDSAVITASVTQRGRAVPNAAVAIRAELIPDTAGNHGGHRHVRAARALESVPNAAYDGRPVAGYFVVDGDRRTSVDASTDENGEVTTTFRAGYLGTRLRVIASAVVGTESVTDTVELAVRVPRLVNAQEDVEHVYWIGGTIGVHPQGVNWYVRDDLIDELQAIADSMQTSVGGVSYYLQYNDLSLPFGGVFTSTVGAGEFDDPARAHTSHTHGVDIDIAFCRTAHEGMDAGQTHRVRGLNCAPEVQVDRRILDDLARRYNGVNRVHNGDHFHIRFR